MYAMAICSFAATLPCCNVPFARAPHSDLPQPQWAIHSGTRAECRAARVAPPIRMWRMRECP